MSPFKLEGHPLAPLMAESALLAELPDELQQIGRQFLAWRVQQAT